MTIWVVRHGCAGRKEDWAGDDDERPLDEAGRRQAAALADLLGPRGPLRLRASPTRRCRDTLVPLGRRLGLPVVDDDDLRSGPAAGGLIALLAAARDGDVLCTHGEVMTPAWARLHPGPAGPPPAGGDDGPLAKGVVWELTDRSGPPRVVPPVPCPDH